MKVETLMTKQVAFCQPDSNLAEIGAKMWTADCGIVPVVDASGYLLGVVTDRDICMALTTRDVPASTVKARDVMTGRVSCCEPDEEVVEALEKMKTHQVRRMPVVEDGGRLIGILSLSDLLRETQYARTLPVQGDLLDTLHAVSEPANAPHQ